MRVFHNKRKSKRGSVKRISKEERWFARYLEVTKINAEASKIRGLHEEDKRRNKDFFQNISVSAEVPSMHALRSFPHDNETNNIVVWRTDTKSVLDNQKSAVDKNISQKNVRKTRPFSLDKTESTFDEKRTESDLSQQNAKCCEKRIRDSNNYERKDDAVQELQEIFERGSEQASMEDASSNLVSSKFLFETEKQAQILSTLEDNAWFKVELAKQNSIKHESAAEVAGDKTLYEKTGSTGLAKALFASCISCVLLSGVYTNTTWAWIFLTAAGISGAAGVVLHFRRKDFVKHDGKTIDNKAYGVIKHCECSEKQGVKSRADGKKNEQQNKQDKLQPGLLNVKINCNAYEDYYADLRIMSLSCDALPKTMLEPTKMIGRKTLAILQCMDEDERDRFLGHQFLRRYLPMIRRSLETFVTLLKHNANSENFLKAKGLTQQVLSNMAIAFSKTHQQMLANDVDDLVVMLKTMDRLRRSEGFDEI